MHAREGQQHPQDKSRELQRKLYLAAKRNRSRRFHALYDRIYRYDVLWRAWKEVKANGGSEGIDGVKIEEVERLGVRSFLERLQADMKEKKYRPVPVRRVYIPKPDGRDRPLGIPTVRDRVVQQACKIVIEPLFEANFLECSYGFRPGRSAGQAVMEVKRILVRRWWVIDADIQGFFDHINHDLLMQLVQRRISDRRVLKLIRQWLRAGVLEGKEFSPTKEGTPQGGVISPLLANIYLHVLDMYWAKKYVHLGKLYRYADDFVVVCSDEKEAKRAIRAIRDILKKLKLTLNTTKTRVVEMGEEGFDFLGFHYQQVRSRRTGARVPLMWPGKKAMKSIRRKVNELTWRRQLNLSMEEVVRQLNPVIRGWRNYFRLGNPTKKFQGLDGYVRQRLWKLFKAKMRQRRFGPWIDKCAIERFFHQGVCVRNL